jgi:acyl carrier protein
MDREAILAEMVPFVVKRGEDVEPEEVTGDVELDSLGIDSVKLGALIGDLQEHMGFVVPKEALEGAPPKTVDDLADRVMLRLSQAA